MKRLRKIPQGLTEKEAQFCEIFVCGCSPYAGNAKKCYAELFFVTEKDCSMDVVELMERQEIKDYITTLKARNAVDLEALRTRLTESLLSIADETSTMEIIDRKFGKQSPAPLRAVAVNAIKAVQEMYPLKVARDTNLNIGTGGEAGKSGGGITFNVIVPREEKEDKNL